MRPKVAGTLALHRVFPPEQLDWMVLFSSCGYLAGFPGQGAYACANSFLDVMARHRRALGDRTTAVAWTAWRGLGMGSTSEFIAAQLEAFGMDTVVADDAMRALDLAMRIDDPNVVVLPDASSGRGGADTRRCRAGMRTRSSRTDSSRRSMRAATWTLKRWHGG